MLERIIMGAFAVTTNTSSILTFWSMQQLRLVPRETRNNEMLQHNAQTKLRLCPLPVYAFTAETRRSDAAQMERLTHKLDSF